MEAKAVTINKQPNAIIYTRQEFTAIEKKIFFHVINQLNPKYGMTQNIFQELVFEIPLKELGIKNHKHIKDVCSKLMSRKLKLQVDNTDDFHFVIPFYEAKYNAKLRKVQLKLAASAVPSFLDLKRGFTQYVYENAMDLTSIYSQRFYELLCGWKSTGTWKVKIDELKNLLSLDGLYEKTYDFRRYVLEVAKQELSEKTDISFEYTFIRTHRVITHVDFTIRKSRTVAKELSQEIRSEISQMSHPQQMVLLETLFVNYGFRDDQKDKIRHSQELIAKLIDIHSRIESGYVQVRKNKTALVIKHLHLN